MYLKRLELSGFKTFADRTELLFGPGITAIVGPNGSGKSNLADAIRWVLGETSWRALRSQRTEDVIFAGTSTRRAHGMAEVHLTVDNEDGVLPVEFTEVTLTRRATRAGDSEFLLNRTPCRLRDVQALFLGTGLGGRAYAMVGQGEVDAVLDASPAERRAMLEEAAGLSRYKRRHHEAARRLEHARQNLTRVLDRLAELYGRAQELARQAERASLHREYQERLRRAELYLQLGEYRRVRAQLRRISAQVEAARQRHAQAQAAVEAVERELSLARARAQQAAQVLAGLQAEVVRALEEAGRAEQDARLCEERASGAAQMLDRIRQELDRLVQEREGCSASAARLREEVAEGAQAAEACARQLQQMQQELEGCQARAEQARADVEAARADVVELEHARAQAHSGRNASRARQEALTSRAQALAAQLDRLEAERLELEARRAALRAEEEDVHVRLRTLTAQLAELRKRLDELAARRAELEQARRELQLRREREQARLAVLEEAQAQLVGYEGGARRVLLAQRNEPGRFAGVRGALVDLLDADPEHRRAVEAALADRLFALVVDSWQAALRVLEELDAESASFLVTEGARDAGPELPAPAGVEGVVGWAQDLVRCPPLVERSVRAGLHGTLVVRDLEAALQVWSSGWRGRLVTLSGEVLTGDGLLAVRRNGSSTPLGRVQEIAALRESLADLDRAQEDLKEQARALDAERDAAERRLAGEQERVERLQAHVHRVREELARAEARQAGLPGLEEQVRAELGQVHQQLQEAREEEARWAADLDRLGLELAEARRKLEAARRRQQEAEAALQAAAAEVAALRVRHAELQAHNQAARARLQDLEREDALLEAQQARLHAELETREAELRQFRELAELATERAARSRQRLEELRARAEEADTARGREERSAAELEPQLASARETCQAAQDEVHRLDLRLAQVAAELGAVERRLWETYQASPEVLDAQAPERLDREALLGEVEALRGLLAGLGSVNLQALEDYRDVQARYEALSAQARDVEEAGGLVFELASRLESVLRRRFRQTFEEVNRHFQDCFRRLFGGGRAFLELVTAEQGEEGVEVSAQPPGKKVRSLGALSGGERVLVALALVFALLRTHPSPFCVFDEIEAALDDANTRRVVELLRELAQRSQVVIITHNKATMEAADVLYGVTTEEPGVSSVVSMRIARKTAEPVAVS
ncbi:MAG: chromosome segregation protein SMC [Armatimonadota bacterium]|nr:chromosome segregation protein SMC [Armatimonadota bacterium]